MPHCCAVNCNSRYKKGQKLSFYRFPVDSSKRVKWIAAIKRENWVPTEYSRVCSKHFVTGKHHNNPRHVDYIPSVFNYNLKPQVKSNQRKFQTLQRYRRAIARARKVDMLKTRRKRLITTAAICNTSNSNEPALSVGDINFGNSEQGVTEGLTEVGGSYMYENNESQEGEDDTMIVGNEVEENMELSANDTVIQHPEVDTILPSVCDESSHSITSFSFLERELEESSISVCELQYDNERLIKSNEENRVHYNNLMVLCQSQAHQLTCLWKMYQNSVRTSLYLRPYKLDASSLTEGNGKSVFYTGLPLKVFQMICGLLKPMVTHPLDRSCTIDDELLYTLVKLRLGLVNRDIAYRANIDEVTFSKIFHRWLNILYREFKQLILWPDTQTLRENLPNCFKEKYSRVVCIIDCFEVFIQRPTSFDARAATYSNYKKHNTIKVLIGISPTGTITFISKAWGGRVSDKIITQRSGFLKKLNYGDIVMADRGFNVSDDIATIGAQLVIPAFTKGKKQLSGMEVEKSRQMSRVRIHVERVIGQLKKKYKILQITLPINIIKRPSDKDVTTIDKIITVTAALVNLCKSVV